MIAVATRKTTCSESVKAGIWPVAGGHLGRQAPGEDRAEDRRAERAADRAEQRRARGRDAEHVVGHGVLDGEHEHLHDHAEAEAQDEHVERGDAGRWSRPATTAGTGRAPRPRCPRSGTPCSGRCGRSPGRRRSRRSAGRPSPAAAAGPRPWGRARARSAGTAAGTSARRTARSRRRARPPLVTTNTRLLNSAGGRIGSAARLLDERQRDQAGDADEPMPTIAGRAPLVRVPAQRRQQDDRAQPDGQQHRAGVVDPCRVARSSTAA